MLAEEVLSWETTNAIVDEYDEDEFDEKWMNDDDDNKTPDKNRLRKLTTCDMSDIKFAPISQEATCRAVTTFAGLISDCDWFFKRQM